jgi:N-acetylglutamate synthase-like GNAT family acetyltransferase
MTSGDNSHYVIRKAQLKDLKAIKKLADQHKNELGFVLRPSLEKSIKAKEVFVATTVRGRVIGFVDYHHRRDVQTTLYHIAVAATKRRRGIGRALVEALLHEAQVARKEFVLLKCPHGLAANEFYYKCKFVLTASENGRKRQLDVWKFALTV